MSDSRESQLKLYSLGIAVEDKKRTEATIRVYPIEEVPYIDGMVADWKETVEKTYTQADGESRTISLDKDAIIIASWLQDGHDNRHSAPDVMKNETVKIYRFGETDSYYWSTLYNEPTVRRLETAVYRWGATKKWKKKLDDKCSYQLVVSAHDKYVEFTTSQDNDELVKLRVFANLMSGEFSVKIGDGEGSGDNTCSFKINGLTGLGELIVPKRFDIKSKLVTMSGDLQVAGTVSASKGVFGQLVVQLLQAGDIVTETINGQLPTF